MEANIYIEGTKYVVPNSITASQWALIAMNPEDKKWFIANTLKIPFSEMNELQAVDIEAIWIVSQQVLRDLETRQKSHIDFEKLTFGQWVDLDVLASENSGTKIVQIVNKLLDEDVADWPLKKVWPHYRDYLFFRQRVYQDYKYLFGQDGEYADEPEETKINIVDVWYDAIMVLANEDFRSIDDVVEKPFRQALNYLAWRKDQVKKREAELKKIQNR